MRPVREQKPSERAPKAVAFMSEPSSGATIILTLEKCS